MLERNALQVLFSSPAQCAGERWAPVVAGAREGEAVAVRHALHEVVVGVHVRLSVAVHQLGPALTVPGHEVTAPEVLSTIGLQAVDAEFVEQVAALVEPPLAGVRVRDVEHECVGEPPAPVAVGGAIRVRDRVAPLEHVRLVGRVLGVLGVELLLDGDLPQQHADAVGVTVIDERLRVRPTAAEAEVVQGEALAAGHGFVRGVVPDVERRLVAPGLDHQHGGRHVLGECAFDLRRRLGLIVPRVRAHPRSERPAGWQRDGAGELGEGGRDFVGRVGHDQAAVEGRPVAGGRLDGDDDVGAAGVDPGGRVAGEPDAPGALRHEEGHGDVRALALLLVLLVHACVPHAATQPRRGEAFAQTVERLVRIRMHPTPVGDDGAVGLLEPGGRGVGPTHGAAARSRDRQGERGLVDAGPRCPRRGASSRCRRAPRGTDGPRSRCRRARRGRGACGRHRPRAPSRRRWRAPRRHPPGRDGARVRTGWPRAPASPRASGRRAGRRARRPRRPRARAHAACRRTRRRRVEEAGRSTCRWRRPEQDGGWCDRRGGGRPTPRSPSTTCGTRSVGRRPLGRRAGGVPSRDVCRGRRCRRDGGRSHRTSLRR